MSKKRLISLLVGLLVGIILIILWLKSIDVSNLFLRIQAIRVDFVIWAALIYLSAYFIRSCRWNILLQRQIKISIARTWLYSMGGNWVNYLIPIRLGEVAKAWFVKRNHAIPMLKVLPSIFIDKSFDTLGIFVVLVMLPLLGLQISTGLTVLLILMVLVLFVSLAVLLFASRNKNKAVHYLQLLVCWLPQRIRFKIDGYISTFVEGLNIFDHGMPKLALAVVLTGLGIALDGFYFWLLFQAFGVHFPFVKVLIGYTLINLSYAIPQPPAQLGSNEWMMIIIFSIGFALTKQDASAIMAFAHLLTAFLIGVLGLLAIAVSGHQILKAIFSGEKIYE